MASSSSTSNVEDVTNFGRSLGHQIVTINVGKGDEVQIFALHKALLCSKVAYFKNMFLGGFEESITNSVNFPEDDPIAFELFVSWLYLDAVPIPEDNATKPMFEVLIRLYAFAEKCVIIKLADQTMEVLTRLMSDTKEKLKLSQIQLAYEITPLLSRLRDFVAKMCVYFILEGDEGTDDLTWGCGKIFATLKGNDDLLIDIISLMRGQNGKVIRNPVLASDCDYHIHAANVGCPYKAEKALASTGSKERSSKTFVTPSPEMRCSLRSLFGDE